MFVCSSFEATVSALFLFGQLLLKLNSQVIGMMASTVRIRPRV